MSEKITFRELIESIAEETDNSKQFTRDFLKDFVHVINGGLEQDGTVNIAGFGKFKLRRMDEREGYNPQTEEKITIPAHNKIVFKPYKDLRELVNAPYAHLESELIEEETNTPDNETENTDVGNQDDFIPTAPPTTQQPLEEKTDDEIESEEETFFDSGDNFDEDIKSPSSGQKTEDEKEEEEKEKGKGKEDNTLLDEIPFDLDNDIDEEYSSPFFDEGTKDETESEQDEEFSLDLGDDEFGEDFSSSVSGQDEENKEDEDIIEFSPETEAEDEKKDKFNGIDKFITPIEPSESENTDTSEDQTETFQDKTESLDNEEKSVEEKIFDDNTDSESDTQDFKAEDDEVIDDDLDDFMGYSDQSAKEKEADAFDEIESSEKNDLDYSEENSIVEDTYQPAKNLDDESDETLDSKEEETDEEQKAPITPSFNQYGKTRKRTSVLPIIGAAALILIVLASGAWYFGLLSGGDGQTMSTIESANPPTANNAIATNNNQQKSTQNTQPQQQQLAKQNQNKPQEPSPVGTENNAQKTTDNTNLEIEKGQTLWSIAEDKYGNPRLWPWIYGNNGSLENPDLIIAGSSLSVPLPSGPQNTLNAADSVGVAKGFLSTYRWYKDNQFPQAKDHLWAAKSYHDDIRDISDIQIDKADLVYANEAR